MLKILIYMTVKSSVRYNRYAVTIGQWHLESSLHFQPNILSSIFFVRILFKVVSTDG